MTAIDEPTAREAGAMLERDARIERLLEAHKGSALSYRQLAYESLKQTRNPKYVWARYHGLPGLEGLTLAKLEAALEEIEDDGERQ